MPKTYTCEGCGGTFRSEWADDAAQAEALDNFGVRGDVPGMAEVCEDCYRAIMATVDDPVLRFHDHLDLCAQCEQHPFELCAHGARLLRAAVGFET